MADRRKRRRGLGGGRHRSEKRGRSRRRRRRDSGGGRRGRSARHRVSETAQRRLGAVALFIGSFAPDQGALSPSDRSVGASAALREYAFGQAAPRRRWSSRSRSGSRSRTRPSPVTTRFARSLAPTNSGRSGVYLGRPILTIGTRLRRRQKSRVTDSRQKTKNETPCSPSPPPPPLATSDPLAFTYPIYDSRARLASPGCLLSTRKRGRRGDASGRGRRAGPTIPRPSAVAFTFRRRTVTVRTVTKVPISSLCDIR